MPKKISDKEFPKHFWSMVDIKTEDECWEWKSYINENGYGTVFHGQKMLKSHRVAYQISKGLIPEKMEVCHTCDNPKCCNPNHLWIGTHAQNMKDMVIKGRSNAPRGAHHPSHQIPKWAQGQNNPRAKLTEEQVRQIKVLLAKGIRQIEIGKMFNVSPITINHIHRGRLWRHLK